MNISAVLASRVSDRGITVAELSRRTRINYDVLCRSLKGISMPKGDQLIRLCRELQLDIGDFEQCEEVVQLTREKGESNGHYSGTRSLDHPTLSRMGEGR